MKPMVKHIFAPQSIRYKKRSILCSEGVDECQYFLEQDDIPSFTSGRSIDFEKSNSNCGVTALFDFLYAAMKDYYTEPIVRSNIEKSKSLSSLSDEIITASKSHLKYKNLGPIRLNLPFCNRVKPVTPI